MIVDGRAIAERPQHGHLGPGEPNRQTADFVFSRSTTHCARRWRAPSDAAASAQTGRPGFAAGLIFLEERGKAR